MKDRDLGTGSSEQALASRRGEDGFMLLGLIVAMAIILLVLGVAASKVAFSLRREREVESARRAEQYVRAIRKFYLKTQHYPGSIEQLENTNNIRFLRKRYVDPLTGKDDYRLIAVGQNKTTVKGFFGQPLTGIPTAGLGSAAGMQSSGVPGAPTGAGAFGATGTGGFGLTTGGGTTAGPGGTTTGGSPGTPGSAGGSGSTLGSAQGMASALPGGVGPFMGVGSSATGSSILIVNEQTSYESWEFLYDPRLEKLRLAGALNAGAGSVGAGSLGSTPGAPGNTTVNSTGVTAPVPAPTPQP
jgi:type II secretory pathway pseudopilin PulG